MTLEELEDFFSKDDREFLEFDRIENPPYRRPDLCAFIKLHDLCGGEGDMVSAAEHDEIFLDIEPETLAKACTYEDLLYLSRCGVRYAPETDSLAMFV
jgi:hypothetical protein